MLLMHMLLQQKAIIGLKLFMKCLERMVNPMVYCKIKVRNADSAVYSIGTQIDDMTGEITFFQDNRPPKLNKQAQKYPIREMHIIRLYGKHMSDFKKGVFKDKIAYEIG